MRLVRILLLVAIGTLFLCGCGEPSEEPTAVPEPTATEVDVSPTEAVPEPSAGESLFKTRCASCHNLNDMPQVGPGLAGLFSRDVLADGREFSEDTLREFITGGSAAMPGVPLGQDELDELIAYLREATE